MIAAVPWRVSKDGLVIAIRLSPKSSRDEVAGIVAAADGPRLAIAVRALPSEGEANAALNGVLAKWLGIAKGRISLASGHRSRQKQVVIAGDGAELARRIEGKLAGKSKDG